MTNATDQNSSVRTRSWMFTPATRPERFGNAQKSGVDVLIVDLEDAVPLNQKDAARANVRELLASSKGIELLPTIAVRINTPLSRLGVDDIAMLLDAEREPYFILVPKVESPEEVLQVQTLLAGAKKKARLIPMIESARGIFSVQSIAGSSPSVAGLMFGAADYASDVRAQPSSLALQLARCHIAAACAHAGVLAIDAPCFALHDPDQLHADLDFASRNGFEAKAAIHPSHVEAINTTFTPSKERVDWAHRVIDAAEKGAGTVDGRMVDEAIAREARRVLAAA
jgi:(S)-citramalyl-CoA lyase